MNFLGFEQEQYIANLCKFLEVISSKKLEGSGSRPNPCDTIDLVWSNEVENLLRFHNAEKNEKGENEYLRLKQSERDRWNAL